jgi:short-subunit dehydrogenase
MSDAQTQTAIVTGGSRGLGLGIVEALIRNKMRVVVVARDAERLASVAKRTGAQTLVADVADDLCAGRVCA